MPHPSASSLPSVRALNDLPASFSALLLLRCLGTSDLAFFHSVFKDETMRDVSEVCLSMLDGEISEGCCYLSDAEVAEFRQLASDILPI